MSLGQKGYLKLEYHTEAWPQSVSMSFGAGSIIGSIINAESGQIAR